MFDTFTVVIPHLPDKELSSNATKRHSHWSQTSKPRQAARLESRMEALKQLGPTPPAVAGRTIRLQVYLHKTTRHRLDVDGLVTSLKPYIDGIFDYLEADDSAVDTICLQRRLNQPQDRMIFVFMDAEAFDE